MTRLVRCSKCRAQRFDRLPHDFAGARVRAKAGVRVWVWVRIRFRVEAGASFIYGPSALLLASGLSACQISCNPRSCRIVWPSLASSMNEQQLGRCEHPPLSTQKTLRKAAHVDSHPRWR